MLEPQLELMPFILELIIIQLRPLLKDLPQQFMQQHLQLVARQQRLLQQLELMQLSHQSELQLDLLEQLIQVLTNRSLHQLAQIQLQLVPMLLELGSMIQIIVSLYFL